MRLTGLVTGIRPAIRISGYEYLALRMPIHDRVAVKRGRWRKFGVLTGLQCPE